MVGLVARRDREYRVFLGLDSYSAVLVNPRSSSLRRRDP